MKQSHFDAYLSGHYLLEAELREQDEIVSGKIRRKNDSMRVVDIIGGIARFVGPNNYADNFGLQWNTFRTTQLDSHTGRPITFNRFWNNTKWKPRDIYGKKILEVGSGAGRFTEILLEAGASVISFDYSRAVEANYLSNRDKGDVFIFQGDVYDMPVDDASFDYILCYGVLQHLPHPDTAFRALFKKLRPGGAISIDYYPKTSKLSPWVQPKYFWRRWTTSMDPEKLLKIIQGYVPYWLPIDTIFRHIPVIGPRLLALLHIPCWNYIHMGFTYRERLQWAIMDTFDALGAKYDIPRTIEEVRAMMQLEDCVDLDLFYGSNGIVANATKPRVSATP